MKNCILGVLLFTYTILSGQTVFQHTTTANNIREHITIIDNSATNGKADALLFILPVTNSPIEYRENPAVKYDAKQERWTIMNENINATMPPNIKFNILVAPPNNANYFTFKVSQASKDATGGFPNGTAINNAATDGKKDALVLITQRFEGVPNNNSQIVSYFNNKWFIANNGYFKRTSGDPTMPINALFNVMVVEKNVASGFPNSVAFKHSATGDNIIPSDKYLTFLDNNFFDKKGENFILATPSQAYNESAITAWYNAPNSPIVDKKGAWALCQSNQNDIPASASFNVVVLKKTSLPPTTASNWDFETGTLNTWLQEGNAFNSQPTYGNTSFSRSGKAWAGSVPLGGDYWRNLSPPETEWHNGRQGNYWIGTSDNHPRGNIPYTNLQGDTPTGKLYSKEFTTNSNYISFLLGGKSTNGKCRVVLLCFDDGSISKTIRKIIPKSNPIRFETITLETKIIEGKSYIVVLSINSSNLVISTEKQPLENKFFVRSYFQIEEIYKNKIARIAIIDDDTEGYINVDDFKFENDISPSPVDNTQMPLWGFVDMHTHLMSHLSMGGQIMYGVPDENSFFLKGSQYRGFDVFKKECNDDVQVRAGSFQNAFFNCNAIHGSPGSDNDCGDVIRSQTVNKLDEKYVKKFKTHLGAIEDHPHTGIDNWPHWSSATHQQMWWEWIKRAKEGGLRVMIALGVQNSLLAKTANAKDYVDDKSSVELQLREIKRFVSDHNDFMEIAKTPQDLRRIVKGNKLAVILGVETEDLGNLTRRKHFNNENITINNVREELRNLYDNYDVRYVFPIHVSNNIFGGAALYKDLFLLTSKYYTNDYPKVVEVANENISFKLNRNSFDFPEGDLLRTRDLGWIIDNQPNYPNTGLGHKNSIPLTDLGQEAVKEMMKMGLMIDIDHMSDLAVELTLSIGRRYNYPLNSGHNGPRMGGDGSNENQKELWQYKAIVDTLGGMIGIGHGGTATGYVTAFRTVLNSLNNKKSICIGTDVNGFYPLAGPDGAKSIDYTALRLSQYTQREVNKTWNINDHGFAHYGLFPDYIQNWKQAGMTPQERQIFFSSAEYFAQMWEKCERQKANIR